ncbi:MAG TPA: hypothetical protein VFG09_08655, partial [Thermodesulfovibrionales bacterium]|nr:hypothetical protein [Thermodesulfovibrionales bacterium]
AKGFIMVILSGKLEKNSAGAEMFKLISRLICLVVIAVVVFLVLSFMSGGEKFRWFGKKIQDESEKVGEKADRLRQTGERVLKGVEKTRETLDHFMGKKSEKSP